MAESVTSARYKTGGTRLGVETSTTQEKDTPNVSNDPRRLLSQLSYDGTDHLKNALDAIKSRRYTQVYTKKPWLDDDGNMIWSPWRVRMAKIVFTQQFETCMGAIIIFNLFLIMYEADLDAQCYPQYAERFSDCPNRSDLIPFLSIGNIVLLTIYSLESMARAFAERRQFIFNAWNVTDLTTVLLGWASVVVIGMVNLNLLRLSRLVRVMRAARVLISIPEFYLLVSGLYSSMKAIIFGSFMLLSAILFWAVISVEVLHPISSTISFVNCQRCNAGFQSVAAAGITLFQQIVAGDSWGQISIPLVEEAPWTAPILFVIMVSISLGVMNLILAVIVERAAEARENDHDRKLKHKETERLNNMIDFAKVCYDMDADESGSLSLEEMLQGYDDSGAFSKLMGVMDIRREDMETIFHVLDTDGSGEVSYFEFCQHLSGFFIRDPAIMQSLIKYSVMELRKVVQADVVEALRQQSGMLDQQTRLLEAMLPAFLRMEGKDAREGKTQPKAEEPWTTSLDFWRHKLGRKDDHPETLDFERPIETFCSIHQQLQPLIARAEELVLEALDYRDARISAAVADAPKLATAVEDPGHREPDSNQPERPRADPVLENQCVALHNRRHQILDSQFEVLCHSFERRLNDIEKLEQQCRDVVLYLKTFSLPLECGEKDNITEIHTRRV